MMEMMSASTKILAGNLLFAACCITYLIWWSIAFRPDYSAPMAPKMLLFLITAALGVSALVMICKGCAASGSATRYIFIAMAGIAVYIILLILTSRFMDRQVTTELMLIVFWACMEVCACSVLLSEGVLGPKAFACVVVIVLAAATAGMLCYLKYYDLPPMTAFYDGMVPLILFAVVMLGISVYQMIRMRS